MRKRKVLLIILPVIILCLILVTLLTLLAINMNQTAPVIEEPESYPESYISIIPLTPKEIEQYKYVITTTDNTIELKTPLNGRVVINLEQRKWKDIQWSPDNKLIAVLGETKTGIYDLFIYNLETRVWIKPTNYALQPSGIDSFKWMNNDVIFFTQGTENNRWVHRFAYSSQQEILKINRTRGVISDVSPDGENLIIKTENDFVIQDIKGVSLYNFETLVTEDPETSQNTNLKIQSVIFSKTPDVLLITSEENLTYTHKLNSQTAEAFKLDDEFAQFKTICSSTGEEFTGYLAEDNEIKILNVSLSTEVKVVASREFQNNFEVNEEISVCSSNETVFNIRTDNQNGWYVIKNRILEKEAALGNALYVSVQNTI
jgi:hypothetical protein